MRCDGWLVLDKPEGIGATEAVARMRKLLDCRKAGHAGTLDPFASGVLPIAFGEATKTVPRVMGGAKSYRFEVAWGEARDTDDCTGSVTETSPIRPERHAIEAALPGFTGEILQRPPDYSALHIDGERAYRRARRGEPVDLAPRTVRVDSLRLLPDSSPARAGFELRCGKGVYVRAIARDLGLLLGCFGHVVQLRRLASGPFTEAGSIALDSVAKIGDIAARRAMLLPVSAGLADIPAVSITDGSARSLRQGQSVPAASAYPDGSTVWAALEGQAVGICRIRAGRLYPSRVFQLPTGNGSH